MGTTTDENGTPAVNGRGERQTAAFGGRQPETHPSLPLRLPTTGTGAGRPQPPCPSAARSFEEFKGLYNAAVDDAAGSRRTMKSKATVDAKTSHGLDGGTLTAREAMKMEKARKKAEEAEK